MQYRVSTHEGVSDQDFSNRQLLADPLKPIIFSKVTDLTDSSLILNDTRIDVPVYHSNGTVSKNRILGGTNWNVDKSATDTLGHEYYRISTDEWIPSTSGMTFMITA